MNGLIEITVFDIFGCIGPSFGLIGSSRDITSCTTGFTYDQRRRGGAKVRQRGEESSGIVECSKYWIGGTR